MAHPLPMLDTAVGDWKAMTDNLAKLETAARDGLLCTSEQARKRSHGDDTHNAGYATYTSLDEDRLPRAVQLASLGKDADEKQRAELERLWRSLSPEARADLWTNQKDNLVAAG